MAGSSTKFQAGNTAAVTHGANSYKANGEAALDARGKGMLAELQEQVTTREGLIAILQAQVVDAVVITRLLKNHAVEQTQKGVPVEDVTALRQLAAYQNTAFRAIGLLMSYLPKDANIVDLDELRRQYAEVGDDEQTLQTA